MRGLSNTDLGVRRVLSFIPTAGDNYWCKLAASTALRVPIPAGASFAVFSFPAGNYAVKWGDSSVTVSLPGSSGLTSALDDYNPSQREIDQTATHLSIISTDAQDGLISFYGR